MLKNFVVVLKTQISIKGQTYPEGTELGTIAVDALTAFEPENILSQIEKGTVDLVAPKPKKKLHKSLKPEED